MLTFLLQGLTLGFAAGAQPGPFQTYLISQTLSQGWRRAWIAAFAPLVATATREMAAERGYGVDEAGYQAALAADPGFARELASFVGRHLIEVGLEQLRHQHRAAGSSAHSIMR